MSFHAFVSPPPVHRFEQPTVNLMDVIILNHKLRGDHSSHYEKAVRQALTGRQFQNVQIHAQRHSILPLSGEEAPHLGNPFTNDDTIQYIERTNLNGSANGSGIGRGNMNGGGHGI